MFEVIIVFFWNLFLDFRSWKGILRLFDIFLFGFVFKFGVILFFE